MDALLDDIVEEFETADRRYEDLEETLRQDPSPEQLRRVYAPFTRQLDVVQDRLFDLQLTMLYLETHDQQRAEYQDRLNYVSNLCMELDALFHHDVTYLPVIWDAYAALDIKFQEFYAVHIPRGDASVQGAPIIAHEIGHSVVDHLDQAARQPFYDRLQEVVSEWPERKQPLVRQTWREWFTELVCDACGLLTFGPAFLLSMMERLCHRDPYQLPAAASPQIHPPDALRLEFVHEYAADMFLQSVYEETHSAYEDFETHLQQVIAEPPPEYESWLDDDLFAAVRAATESALDDDIESLCRNIDDGVDPVSVEHQALRLQSNREWLARQNGG